MRKLMMKLALSPNPTPAFGDSKLPLVPFKGPGVTGGFDPEDVMQGALGDCFLPSALGAMAQFMDRDLHKAFHDNKDGTFTVTFQKNGKAYPYRVSNKFYQRDDGKARYMKTEHQNIRELWPALFEKALALHESEMRQISPTYRAIGDGGFASDVIALLTGKKARFRTVTGATMLWNEITRAVDNDLAACLGTFTDGRKYKNSGIIDDHSYSVLGYDIDEDGEKWVCLRNPWGDTEPQGNGPDDGEFWLPLADAVKYYESFESVT